jgi:hypothetical protein
MMELNQLNGVYKTEAEVTAPDGTKHKLDVAYKAITPPMLRQIEEIKADPTKTTADQAIILVDSFPGSTRNGEPVKITLELFQSWDARNVEAVLSAITRDFYGIPSPERVSEVTNIIAEVGARLAKVKMRAEERQEIETLLGRLTVARLFNGEKAAAG